MREHGAPSGGRAAWTAALHPILFSLYAVLAVLATNIAEIELSDAYRSLGAALVLAATTFLGWRLVVRDGLKAGPLASLCLLAFLSYGHLYTLVKSVSVGGVVMGRHRFLAPAVVTLVVLGIIVILRTRRDLRGMTRMLNVAAVAALIGPLATLGSVLLEKGTAPPTEGVPQAGSPTPPPASLPDIYYIMLDEYARSDLLRERFGYDNTGFEEYLTNRGFYVATESRSNYGSTALSTAATLNLDYLDNLPIDLTRGHYPLNLREPIVHSALRERLEALGYVVVAFPSGYAPTELYDADYFLAPDMAVADRLQQAGALNRFEAMLFSTTAGRLLLDLDSLMNTPLSRFIAERVAAPENLQKGIILSTFDYLGQVADIPGPKFVFAHLTTPHSPYFFGPNGEDLDTPGVLTFENPSGTWTWRDDIPKYVGQLRYVNSRLEQAIDAILAKSAARPIILLQSDHGARMGIDWGHPDEQAVLAQASILNAYYLPSECSGDLRPDISPVNSFRMVLNCLLGPTYPLLPDVAYYNPHVRSQPWDLRPVDELLQEIGVGAP